MNHIHLSVVSALTTAAIVILTTFFLHMAAMKLTASENPTTQAWGKAFAAGWG
jgi:hypothetical protein